MKNKTTTEPNPQNTIKVDLRETFISQINNIKISETANHSTQPDHVYIFPELSPLRLLSSTQSLQHTRSSLGAKLMPQPSLDILQSTYRFLAGHVLSVPRSKIPLSQHIQTFHPAISIPTLQAWSRYTSCQPA